MSRNTTTVTFQALEIKGSLLPASLLEEISKLERPKEMLLEPGDYGLSRGERLRDRIDAAWVLTKELWEEYVNLKGRAGQSIAGQHFGMRLLREVFSWSGIEACNGWRHGESSYAINYRAFAGSVPLILRGIEEGELDKGSAQFGQEGRRRSPHSCLQECLNADDSSNWGVLISGDRLRLLHDNPSLVKPAYLAADLELLIEGECFDEFSVLWLLLHASRFQHPQTGSCVLDDWKQKAEASGERVLDALRGGVQGALQFLGSGFLNHPANGELRDALFRHHTLSTQHFHEQLLRLVYRFLFLFTAEDRGLLFPRDLKVVDPRRRIYREGYSVTRLRELAIKRSAYEGEYGDLWELQRLVFQQLSIGNSPLGLPGLGGLFSLEQCPDLQGAELWNGPLLRAIKAIGWFDAGGIFTRVRYRDLNTEELGSVYEGLLELHPQLEQQGSQWLLSYGGGAGSDRKTTGSYYTPDALVQELIKSALVPVIEDRLSKANGPAEQEQALLDIKVIDPACGSGHFLLAAARRLAVALAQVRAGEDQPSEGLRQECLRDVVARCIYAVDKNPMAVELCKVALWIEAIDPGKPLSFLDAHIQCGDSLVGVFDPKVLEDGIPDEAYKQLTGDDKTVCSSLKKENAAARKTISRRGSNRGIQESLDLSGSQPRSRSQQQLQAIERMPENTLAEAASKQAAYAQWQQDSGTEPEILAADVFTAAFFLAKSSETRSTVPTTQHLLKLLAGQPIDEAMEQAVQQAARNFRFLHWHLRFGEVLALEGFDCVLGNPPWEQLEASDVEEKVRLSKEQNFTKASGRFPISSTSRKNLFSLFAELIWSSLVNKTCSGIIVPTSIAQDAPSSTLIYDLIKAKRLESLVDIENKKKKPLKGKWFHDVHANYRFSLVTVNNQVDRIKSLFFFDTSWPRNLDEAVYYSLMDCDLEPSVRNCFRVPLLRNNEDIAIQNDLSRLPTFVTWLDGKSSIHLKSGLMFNAEASVKNLRVDAINRRGVSDLCAVIEGYNIYQFNCSYASSPGISCSEEELIVTTYYLPTSIVEQRIKQISPSHGSSMLVLRRQARSADRFIAIAAVTSLYGAEGSLTCFFTDQGDEILHATCAVVNSLIFNYLVARRQAGPNLNKSIWSTVPIPTLSTEAISKLAHFSRRLHTINPSSDEFAQEKATLDSLVFEEYFKDSHHVKGQTLTNIILYVLSEFNVLESAEIRQCGEYRTQRLVLEAWDRLFGA